MNSFDIVCGVCSILSLVLSIISLWLTFKIKKSTKQITEEVQSGLKEKIDIARFTQQKDIIIGNLQKILDQISQANASFSNDNKMLLLRSMSEIERLTKNMKNENIKDINSDINNIKYVLKSENLNFDACTVIASSISTIIISLTKIVL